jgi:8-oxo-dGTP diphosphatase
MSASEETYSAPIASVDLVILGLAGEGLEVLLVQRVTAPLPGKWALPGGWIHVNEDVDLEAAARRVLRDKTGVQTPYLEQIQTFGSAARDPRGWAISVAYVALLSADDVRLSRDTMTADAKWHTVESTEVGLALAFDHALILRAALSRVRSKVEYSTLPVHLLPERFTMTDLQMVYEHILGRQIEKSAFRKRMAEADFVEPIPGEMRRASNRPAQIYRLKQESSTTFFNRTI